MGRTDNTNGTSHETAEATAMARGFLASAARATTQEWNIACGIRHGEAGIAQRMSRRFIETARKASPKGMLVGHVK
jgi:hypothetical protein